jgi:anti-anti-sigma regulatory factor
MLPKKNIAVPDILDFASIDALSQQFRPLMASASNITVDAANVMRVSTAALQFLLTVAKQMQVEGGTVTMANPSEALSRAVALLGLGEEFSRLFKGWQK